MTVRYERETSVGECTSRVMLEITSDSDAEARATAATLIAQTIVADRIARNGNVTP